MAGIKVLWILTFPPKSVYFAGKAAKSQLHPVSQEGCGHFLLLERNSRQVVDSIVSNPSISPVLENDSVSLSLGPESSNKPGSATSPQLATYREKLEVKSRKKRFSQCDRCGERNKEAQWPPYQVHIQRSYNRELEVHMAEQPWSRCGSSHRSCLPCTVVWEAVRTVWNFLPEDKVPLWPAPYFSRFLAWDWFHRTSIWGQEAVFWLSDSWGVCLCLFSSLGMVMPSFMVWRSKRCPAALPWADRSVLWLFPLPGAPGRPLSLLLCHLHCEKYKLFRWLI